MTLAELPESQLLRVVYDNSILRPEVPYTIETDRQRLTRFLITNGMDPNRVPEMTLLFQAEDPNQLISLEEEGYYTDPKQQIGIYTNIHWKSGHDITSTFRHEAGHAIPRHLRSSREHTINDAIKGSNLGMAAAGFVLGTSNMRNPEDYLT